MPFGRPSQDRRDDIGRRAAVDPLVVHQRRPHAAAAVGVTAVAVVLAEQLLAFATPRRRSPRTALCDRVRRRRPPPGRMSLMLIVAGRRRQRRLRPIIPLLALAAAESAEPAPEQASGERPCQPRRMASVDARHAVLGEDRGRSRPRWRSSERSSRSRSARSPLAHAHRDVERERQAGTSPRRQRRDRQRLVLPRREIAGQRPPDQRDIDRRRRATASTMSAGGLASR